VAHIVSRGQMHRSTPSSHPFSWKEILISAISEDFMRKPKGGGRDICRRQKRRLAMLKRKMACHHGSFNFFHRRFNFFFLVPRGCCSCLVPQDLFILTFEESGLSLPPMRLSDWLSWNPIRQRVDTRQVCTMRCRGRRATVRYIIMVIVEFNHLSDI